MAERMVSMEIRLAIASFELVDDGQAEIAEVCARLGISRDTFYRYRRRFRDQGWSGLLPRSSRPRSSPHQTPAELEALIVATRHELIAQGWDAGARSIHARLLRAGVPRLPTPRTVHRVLVRAGVVEEQPAKRPRSSFIRFEHAQPNGCWQIDGTGWHLADGTPVCIVRVIDDHSRMIMATRVGAAETTQLAWACVESAIGRHGIPAMMLSDGGTAFTARRRGQKRGLNEFEARLRALGIHPVVSSPSHPQTCGKKERDWQPFKRWLAAQPPASTIAELQALVDAYDVLFNTERPHQALDGQTPDERYRAGTKATPTPEPLPAPCQVTHPLVTDRGRIALGNGYRICIGPEWTGQRLTVVRDDLDVVILHGHQIVLQHHIDTSRKHQASGRPTGRRPRRVASDTS